MSLARAAFVLLLLSLAGNGRAQTTPANGIALTHVAIIEMATGAIRTDMTVLVRGDRIAEILPGSARVPAGTIEMDGRGKFAIPGLWDMHVHLSYAKSSALPLFIANGVTGVRDVGSNLPEIDAWRNRIDEGLLVGPRIIRSGPILNGQSLNPYQIAVGNSEQARGIVRALKQVGVDCIKVHRRVPRDDYFAIAEEAKAQGLILVGHIPLTVTPQEASDAGQLFEHVDTLFEGTFIPGRTGEPLLAPELPDAIRAFRNDGAEALFARLVRNGTSVTPTLRFIQALVEDENGGLTESRLRYIARSARSSIRLSPETLAARRRLYAESCAVVRMMSRSGVILLAGTDTSGAPAVPGFFLQEELAALVEAGVTPLIALQSATLNPAKAMKREEDFGEIATGKVADILLLDANPLADIHNTQRIRVVVSRGKILPREALDKLLKTAEELAERN